MLECNSLVDVAKIIALGVGVNSGIIYGISKIPDSFYVRLMSKEDQEKYKSEEISDENLNKMMKNSENYSSIFE